MAQLSKSKKKSRRAGRPVGTDNDTRAMIVRATSALLAEMGIDGLSNRLICERCAVTPPTLYHHFPDKKALLDAAVTLAFAEFIDGKREVPVSGEPMDRYKEGWRNLASFAATRPEHFKLMASAMLAKGMPIIGYELYNHVIADLEGMQKAYGLRFTVPLAAQLTMAIAFGTCMLPAGAPDIPWESDFSEAALEALLRIILK
jgi:AcrR family transcriptional regulator